MGGSCKLNLTSLFGFHSVWYHWWLVKKMAIVLQTSSFVRRLMARRLSINNTVPFALCSYLAILLVYQHSLMSTSEITTIVHSMAHSIELESGSSRHN